MKRNILIIDEDPISRRIVSKCLEPSGYRVIHASDGEGGLYSLTHEAIDAVLVDQKIPKLDGIALVAKMHEIALDVPVIMFTANGSIPQPVKAMQHGAVHYLTKPVNKEELEAVVHQAVEQNELKKEIKQLKSEAGEHCQFGGIVYKSKSMRQICQLAGDLADTDATVFIRGETGTGKEMIAKMIHRRSRRKDFPMICFKCGALSETLLESELFGHEKGAFTGASKTRIGRFEQASGGTVFLDEIGDIPLHTQIKLLRVLQEREFERVGGNETIKVDVRFISATNKDMRHALAAGKFREDLFFRLNVMPVEIPPLRDRLEDLPPLAFHFLKKFSAQFQKEIGEIEPEAIRLLLRQRWPGNVRELQNTIERAVVLEKSPVLTRTTLARCLQVSEPDHFQFPFPDYMPYREAKRELCDRFEREYLARLLKKEHGNITHAARLAKMDYKSFYEKMKKHHLSKWDFKDEGKTSNG
jgi:DNA-binding NtrC family response regulator